jgi:ankyrin repeat protein
MFAAAKGHNKIVTALVNAGADVKQESKIGETAVDWAKKRGNDSVLKILTMASS